MIGTIPFSHKNPPPLCPKGQMSPNSFFDQLSLKVLFVLVSYVLPHHNSLGLNILRWQARLRFSVEVRHAIGRPWNLWSMLACWNLQDHGLLNQQRAGNRVMDLQNINRIQLERTSLFTPSIAWSIILHSLQIICPSTFSSFMNRLRFVCLELTKSSGDRVGLLCSRH